MTKTFKIDSVEALPAVAREVISVAESSRILAFYGAMGAGKTTLIRQICKVLQVQDAVSSPTFSLVNEYLTSTGETIFHFDFYRIRDLEEVYDIGYEMYFESGSYCFIEWAENIEPLLPPEVVKIEIEATAETSREIKVHLPSA